MAVNPNRLSKCLAEITKVVSSTGALLVTIRRLSDLKEGTVCVMGEGVKGLLDDFGVLASSELVQENKIGVMGIYFEDDFLVGLQRL
jgi:hypothetical protein